MITCNCNATDYIDERYRFRDEVIAERCCSEIDEAEIIARHEKRMRWLGRFGAVVAFCRWPGDGRYYLTLKFWRVIRRSRPAISYLANGPMVVLAGFMSEARGLHWDRKRG